MQRVGKSADSVVVANKVILFEKVRKIDQIIWNTDYSNNDIALLKLKSPLVFNQNVQPACLPPSIDYYPVHKTCFVSGWGKLGISAPTPQNLQFVDVKIFSKAECKARYPQWFKPQHEVCAGSEPQPGGSCRGDSGGPLVCDFEGKAVIFGVVSWSIKGKCGIPSVYARVPSFLNWIKSKIEIVESTGNFKICC